MHNIHNFRITCIWLCSSSSSSSISLSGGVKKDQMKIKFGMLFLERNQQRKIKTFDLDLFDLESAACLTSRGCLKGRNSIPPMYGCSTFGISTPSSLWKFSRIQHNVLSVAVSVELSIWTNCLDCSSFCDFHTSVGVSNWSKHLCPHWMDIYNNTSERISPFSGRNQFQASSLENQCSWNMKPILWKSLMQGTMLLNHIF